MLLQNQTVLITGGGSGIGLALALKFIELDNTVIICGRREEKLREACSGISKLHYKVCDISVEDQRRQLFESIAKEFPSLSILVNNAGVQIETDFSRKGINWLDIEKQLDINLKGTVAMCTLFGPHFISKQNETAICNVTSGLAYVPIKSVPVYCATKAGLHSFTMCLRSQFEKTNTKVFEVLPPIVDTELHREESSKKQGSTGVSPDYVADKIIKALQNNKFEAPIGRAWDLKMASRISPNFFHRLLNKLV